MELYQVSFHRIYPGCREDDDSALTAFVQASDWNEAARKVEQRYKKEFESAKIYGISKAQNCEIII